MHNQYTDILLNIPEVEVQHMKEIDEQTIQIEVRPRAHIQTCSICGSDRSVIRKGRNRTRKVRHLNAFCKTVYLLAPAIRLYCKDCHAGFVWRYAFVDSGKRYSTAFEEQASRLAAVSTVKQSADIHCMPGSTLQTKQQRWLARESKRLKQRAWKEAVTSSIVLGIDDFAIRKGHT